MKLIPKKSNKIPLIFVKDEKFYSASNFRILRNDKLKIEYQTNSEPVQIKVHTFQINEKEKEFFKKYKDFKRK